MDAALHADDTKVERGSLQLTVLSNDYNEASKRKAITSSLTSSPSMKSYSLIAHDNSPLNRTSSTSNVQHFGTDHVSPSIPDPTYEKTETLAVPETFPALVNKRIATPTVWPPKLFHEAFSRIPFYISDVRDGWHRKTLSSMVFIFFVSIAPALTFGEFLHDKTDGQWGVGEVLLSTSMTGILYTIFAAQPLTIVGVSGPITIIARSLYTLSVTYDINFIVWFSWCNIWTAVLHFLLCSVNAPAFLVSWVSRFSEDVFGLLISIIYIVNAIQDLVNFFDNPDYSLDAQYFCFILCTGVCILALYLHNARKWKLFSHLARDLIADYALPISCIIWTLFTYLPHFEPTRETLPFLVISGIFVPSTSTGRIGSSWFPNLLSIPNWAIASAVLPAILVTLLFWFDHCVSKLSSELPEFGLKKPVDTFNYDFLFLD